MIESVSLKLAERMKAVNPEETPSVNVMRYSIKLILLHVITVLLVVISGLLIGDLGGVMISLLAFAALRFVSGGLHISSAWLCSVVSCVVLHANALLAPELLSGQIVFVQLVTVVLIIVFAPSNIEKQTNFKKENYKWLKIISLIMCLLNIFVLKNELVTSAFFIQGLTLLTLKKGEV